MTLGEKIKTARTAAGLTQAQLAERLLVSRPAVTKWETDKGIPDIENLKLIARYLGVSLDELLSDEEPADAPSPAAGEVSAPNTSESKIPMSRRQKAVTMGKIVGCTLVVDLPAVLLSYCTIADGSAVVLPILLTFLPILMYRLWMPSQVRQTWIVGGSMGCAVLSMVTNAALYALYTWLTYGTDGLHLILWKDLLCLTGGMVLFEMAWLLPLFLSKCFKTVFSVVLAYGIVLILTLACAFVCYIPIGNETIPAEMALLIGFSALVGGMTRTICIAKRRGDKE